MKKIKLVAAAVALLIVFATVSSCGKTANPTSYGSWSGTINFSPSPSTQTYSNEPVQLCSYQKSTKTLSLRLTPSLTAQYPNIRISGADTSGADIASGKSYNLNGSSGFSAIYTPSAGSQLYVTDLIGSGQLNVKQFDLSGKTMSATFNFTSIVFQTGVHDTVFVTNGSLPSSTIFEF